VVLIVGAATVAGFAPPAGAAVLDLTCAGSQTVTYSPGLTLVPTDQSVTVTTNYAACVSTTQPAITSGQSFVATDVPGRTCLSPLDTDTITVTDLAATILVTYTGTVVSGVFAGGLLAQVIEYPNIVTITCAITPLTSRTGVSAAEITSV
jgi:hypothetical protein